MAGGIGAGLETLNIDTGAADQASTFSIGDAELDELFLVVGVLEHHGGAASHEGCLVHRFNRLAEQAAAFAGAQKHMAQTSHSVEHPIHTGPLSGDGAVKTGLDREVMHQIGLLTPVDAQQIHQGMGFRQGIHGATGHHPGVHAESLRFQQRCVGIVGGH